MSTFIENFLENNITFEKLHDEIDNFIDIWHDNSIDTRELHDAIGITKTEYAQFCIKAYTIEQIVCSYKFQKHIIDRINNILQIPDMYGSCNESIELQILTLLEVWYFELNIQSKTIEERFILNLYISETKKIFLKLGSLVPSSFIQNKDEFVLFLKKIIPVMIENIKKLRK